jgi:hypothetical protein
MHRDAITIRWKQQATSWFFFPARHAGRLCRRYGWQPERDGARQGPAVHDAIVLDHPSDKSALPKCCAREATIAQENAVPAPVTARACGRRLSFINNDQVKPPCALVPAGMGRFNTTQAG